MSVRITIELGKQGGRPCIRRTRITNVLGWLAAGMSHAQISDDFPKLTEDIRACLELAAECKYCFQVREQFQNF